MLAQINRYVQCRSYTVRRSLSSMGCGSRILSKMPLLRLRHSASTRPMALIIGYLWWVTSHEGSAYIWRKTMRLWISVASKVPFSLVMVQFWCGISLVLDPPNISLTWNHHNVLVHANMRILIDSLYPIHDTSCLVFCEVRFEDLINPMFATFHSVSPIEIYGSWWLSANEIVQDTNYKLIGCFFTAYQPT